MDCILVAGDTPVEELVEVLQREPADQNADHGDQAVEEDDENDNAARNVCAALHCNREIGIHDQIEPQRDRKAVVDGGHIVPRVAVEDKVHGMQGPHETERDKRIADEHTEADTDERLDQMHQNHVAVRVRDIAEDVARLCMKDANRGRELCDIGPALNLRALLRCRIVHRWALCRIAEIRNLLGVEGADLAERELNQLGVEEEEPQAESKDHEHTRRRKVVPDMALARERGINKEARALVRVGGAERSGQARWACIENVARHARLAREAECGHGRCVETQILVWIHISCWAVDGVARPCGEQGVQCRDVHERDEPEEQDGELVFPPEPGAVEEDAARGEEACDEKAERDDSDADADDAQGDSGVAQRTREICGKVRVALDCSKRNGAACNQAAHNEKVANHLVPGAGLERVFVLERRVAIEQRHQRTHALVQGAEAGVAALHPWLAAAVVVSCLLALAASRCAGAALFHIV
eukprot:comp22059_c0_seq1/m.50987 comp22059_c0_seq1/g.50987  ORF comp22059_c0_seq1/g.50987 comp22059_c0_seq1/m.50987 type:complete len:472 (+) comp22059_c0_seq1:943-2358(+)